MHKYVMQFYRVPVVHSLKKQTLIMCTFIGHAAKQKQKVVLASNGVEASTPLSSPRKWTWHTEIFLSLEQTQLTLTN